jgi:N6-L-threonylcarbamoyladenine synthase
MVDILAIESSCDETAAAVVRDGRYVLANVVASQIELHRRYGGVFPEAASRQHVRDIAGTIREAMTQAQVGWDDLAAIAVVNGPGLAGSLLVGVNAAKGLAAARGLPLVGVNHMEGHIYAHWLECDGGPETPPPFPSICLIVSGGHTDLVMMHEHLRYERLGKTVDDAAGEAFDKVARLLGLGYPGGPAIQRAATRGNPQAYALPRALNVGPYDFSFSGLKTAVLRLVQELQHEQGLEVQTHGLSLADAAVDPDEVALPIADIAASFQAALVDALVTKTVEATENLQAAEVLVAGGVAANQLLRQELVARSPKPVRFPQIRHCTDNAAMIGAAAYYRFLDGRRSGLDLDVIPNLALV